jgi:hypothetical protein
VLDQCNTPCSRTSTFWPTLFAPLLYRFRPWGNNPDESLMEVYMLYPIPVTLDEYLGE